ncbi:primosomal protein N'' [Neorhizobium sp. 2083]|uniref:hypothetical protein n=1 Tax=Neorhizobium sp. 2083 TaxID=2817762 RepID=UPI00285DA55F|nr:hypothetical protein [Neorhizobium sp. 2083]MDR6816266.1 primosomal protein N'' [Neorhizobium sp. 2083]
MTENTNPDLLEFLKERLLAKMESARRAATIAKRREVEMAGLLSALSMMVEQQARINEKLSQLVARNVSEG